jgi:VCBS repeat protein/HYR domain-containing protein
MQRQPVDTPMRLARVLSFGLLVVMLCGLFEQQTGAPATANTNRNLNSGSILLNDKTFVPAGAFCGKSDFLTGSVPFSVAIGDFNADGILDLAVANSNSDSVSIFLGTGTGSFAAKTDFTTGAGPFAVAVGDFNADGKLDLATANANSDTVSILLGTGTGSFGSKTNFATGGAPRSIAVGDFNADGKLDLAVANANSNTISILLGTGTGGFGAKTDFAAGAAPRSVVTGDFNHNGKADLAVANSNSNTVSILLGTGTGSFGAKTDYGTGAGPFSVAVGDFNGDANLDLAVANANNNTVSILLGTGAGTFGVKTDFGAGDGPFSVAAGDFNADGRLDLAMANLNSDSVSILPGTGTGSFGMKTEFVTGTTPRSVATGDFNNDGKLDLAVANEISSSVSVLLNACTNNPPGITSYHLTLTAGSPPTNDPIAFVNDVEDAENTLVVSVNGGTNATVNGVTVSSINVNVNGLATANLVAGCDATTAYFTVRVTDSGGLSSEAALTVTVNPNTTPPTLTCPGETVGHTDLDQCSTVVTFSPTATGGNCSGMLTPVCSPASGSRFSKGVTTVTCHVSDSSGNQASCSFQVRVIDAQRPRLTGPGNIVKSTEPFQCSAVVTYPLPTVTDNCPGPFNPTCSPSSGFRFPMGTTLVTCHVVDQSANEQTSVFEVTVVDAQAPTFATPGNIAATAAASCPYATSKVVSYSNPVATDNCAVQSVVCNPPSGSTFPVGATTVNCAATDTSGNMASCRFTVNVYSFGIQDEMNAGNVVLINASTGDYSFCCNGVPIASGRGILGVSGCVGSIDHMKGDRRIHIEWDASANGNAGTGFAYVKQSSGTVCQITDKQLTNNACQCSTQSPPAIIIAPAPPRG